MKVSFNLVFEGASKERSEYVFDAASRSITGVDASGLDLKFTRQETYDGSGLVAIQYCGDITRP